MNGKFQKERIIAYKIREKRELHPSQLIKLIY